MVTQVEVWFELATDRSNKNFIILQIYYLYKLHYTINLILCFSSFRFYKPCKGWKIIHIPLNSKLTKKELTEYHS